jgi:hypothetical protein
LPWITSEQFDGVGHEALLEVAHRPFLARSRLQELIWGDAG